MVVGVKATLSAVKKKKKKKKTYKLSGAAGQVCHLLALNIKACFLARGSITLYTLISIRYHRVR